MELISTIRFARSCRVLIIKRIYVMSSYNQRGIFLQLATPSIVSPNEVRVSMQFALKEEGDDAPNQAVNLLAV